MIITVTQPEIEAGIKMYLAKLGVNMTNVNVSMNFSAKRVGGAGIVAEVDITPNDLKVAVVVATTEAPEAAVEGEEVVAEAEEETKAVTETEAVAPAAGSIFG